MDLGKRLKAKRKEKNISAEYLAKELGISVSTVYRYEDSSILKIPVSTFEKMCDILGTTPAQIYVSDNGSDWTFKKNIVTGKTFR